MKNPWSTLVGHRQTRVWFANAIRNGRHAGSFLFVGPHGVGKQTFADLLALTLLCERHPAEQMHPCGSCAACVQVKAETHPDVIRVAKPNDKSVIPLDLLIGPPEARMQAGFCRDVRLKPFRGRQKLAILQDADFLNEEGANCLLKTLEEPPPEVLIILIGVSEQRQLPTIRSRCRVIRFLPPAGPQAAQLLRSVHGIEASDDEAARAVETAAGDMHVAARLLDDREDPFPHDLVEQLRQTYPEPITLSRLIHNYVQQAGKTAPAKKHEAAHRRAAMRDVFSIAIQHYRQQMRREAAEARTNVGTLARLDRSVRALREVDRNANQATLVECYASDLASGITGNRGEIG
jgi:DNA polymerase-3 subunit delta'